MRAVAPEMYAPSLPHTGSAPAPGLSLRAFALAAAAAVVERPAANDAPAELRYLLDHLAAVATPSEAWYAGLADYVARPHDADVPLLALAREIGMSLAELIAVALATAVEDEVMAGRALAYLQAPVGGSRPTLGLMASLLGDAPQCAAAASEIAAGTAQRSGVLCLQGEGPLPERVLSVASPIALGLRGIDWPWPGISIGVDGLPPTALPQSILEDAARNAAAEGASATDHSRTV